MQHRFSPRRLHQRGAATLVVTMVLLFSTSIIMLYLNRSILFEQRTAANQVRSATALEMAEAGIEWATGMLNTTYRVTSACAESTAAGNPGTFATDQTFQRRYVFTEWATTSDVRPATTVYPGCKVNGTTLTCTCHTTSGSAASDTGLNAAGVLPGFTLAFAQTASDPEAVQVIATGCTAQSGACTPTNAPNSDATATVSVILKLKYLLRAAPASPLTCGTNCNIGGSYDVINRDVGTNGILVNSGGAVSPGGGDYTTIPGQPAANASVENDASISALVASDPTCSNSAMFRAYFGTTIAQYAANPRVKTIPNCGTANTCGDLVDAAYTAGYRSFYFPDGFARNNSSGDLGTASDPVTMVSAAGFDINGNIDIFGMVFSNSATVDSGTGSANINGALVSCSNYSSNGNGSLTYDAPTLKASQRQGAMFVRVPGSWTDRCRATAADPPVVTCN